MTEVYILQDVPFFCPAAMAAEIFSFLNFFENYTPDPPNNYILLHF